MLSSMRSLPSLCCEVSEGEQHGSTEQKTTMNRRQKGQQNILKEKVNMQKDTINSWAYGQLIYSQGRDASCVSY